MAVYVDNMRARYGRMVMSHMIADSTEELLEMADAIGVPRRWIQSAGSYREHFDVCQSKRLEAIGRGAIEVTQLALGRMIMQRREPHGRQ